MARNLLQILLDAQAFLDLDATTTPSGTDLATRTNYADRAVREAAAYKQLNEFNAVYVTSVSTLASISLPSNFREFLNSPKLDTGTTIYEYPEIRPQERFDKNTDDKYCYVLGNPGNGYTAVFNNLQVGATLSIDYQRYPVGFATLTDVCELSDDTYVVRKIESYVLQSRSDDRFPIINAEANKILENMAGRSDKTPGGGLNQVPFVNKTFRIGV